jgi:hypothetical protein
MAGAAEQRRRARLLEGERKLRADLNALYQKQLAAKDERIAELEAWKKSAAKILNECCLQEVGEELGVPLGQSIYAAILPGVRALKAENAKLRRALDQATQFCRLSGPDDTIVYPSDIPTDAAPELATYLREKEPK